MAHEVIPIVIVAVLLTLMLTVWRFGQAPVHHIADPHRGRPDNHRTSR
jgi:hypothetical protein